MRDLDKQPKAGRLAAAKGRRAAALLVAIGLLALLVPVIAMAAVSADPAFEVVFETRKFDTAGGSLNRYSVTDAGGYGYGVHLSYANSKLTVERRDAWGATTLATSLALPGGMALGQWYTLRLMLQGDQLTAEAYLGQVNPAEADPEVSVTASDSSYDRFTQLGVNGGRTFDTDRIRVFENGEVVIEEDFDDGDASDWVQFRSGQVDLWGDGASGYFLRKSGFNDPNGGILALPFVGALAVAPAEFDATLETQKVNTAGGAWNRYSFTDANGNGYGLVLDYGASKLRIERRDAWAATSLATSTDALDPLMDLGEWFTLNLYRQGDQLAAEAYRGRVDPNDPATPPPEITAFATDATYNEFTLFGVLGGRDYDTDNIRVLSNDQVVLEDDFDDGAIWEWKSFRSGVIGLEVDGSGGFVLRKTGFNDPNGGTVGLAPPLLDVKLATLKADTTGGAQNRYSITDAAGNGYGVVLIYPAGTLRIERRDEWAATTLATSSETLPGGMALDTWYSLSLYLKDGKLTAEAADPNSSDPPIRVTANDSTYTDFVQFGVNGGRVFLTDDILVRINGEVALEEDFSGNGFTDWETFRSGQIELAEPVPGNFALRKFANNDPNGGLVGLIPGLTVLTFNPTTDGVTGIGDYETEYGVTFTGAALSTGSVFPQDGFGIQNAAAVAVVEFDSAVSRIELEWVRLYEDMDFVATAKDAGGNIQYYFLSEACPFSNCSFSSTSGTEVITGEGIVRLEFEGTPPGGSAQERSDPIVGLGSLIFAP